MYILKTNTAVRIAVGPLVDPTDGKTAETALTVTGLSMQLYRIKNDGSAVVRTQVTPTASGGNNDMALVTSSTDGMYDLELTAAQLNFLGNARITFYDVDGFLVHWIDLLVVSAAFFDWIYGSTKPTVLLSSGTGTGQLDFTSGVVKSNLAQILGTALTETAGYLAAAFKKFFNVGSPTGTVNSIPDAVPGANGGLPTTNGTKVNQTVDLTAGQEIAANLTKVNGVAQVATLDTIKAETAAILEDTGTTLPATLLTINNYLDTEIAAILADTNELQTDWVNGGRLDLLIDAIKAKTDALPGSVWDYPYDSLTTDDSIGEKFYGWFASVPVGSTALGATDLVLINNALTLLGHDTLADLTGTDKATTICVQHYQQVVDAVLRAYQWNCAMTRSSELTAESTAPSFGYNYKYALPDDCLRVLQMQELDYKFKVEGGYLLTDEESAYILYIARISPASMDALLKGAISAALAATIAFPLTNSPAAAKQMWDLYQAKLDEARTTDAFEGTHEAMQPGEDNDWTTKRS